MRRTDYTEAKLRAAMFAIDKLEKELKELYKTRDKLRDEVKNGRK